MRNFTLSNPIRDQILKRLLSQRFDAEDAVLKGRRAVLGYKIYADKYGMEINQLEAARPGMFPETSEMRAKIQGHVEHFRLSEAVRLPYEDDRHGNGPISKVYEATTRVATEFQRIENDEQDVRDRKADLKAQIMALLNSTSSTRKLVEKWPEVEPYLVEFAPAVRNEVVVATSLLNDALGIPVELKEAA